MLKASDNQDLSFVGLQLSEILFLVDQADRFGSEYVLEQIKHCAQEAADRFERPQGVIVFELAE
jgi:hypothetical protein